MQTRTVSAVNGKACAAHAAYFYTNSEALLDRLTVFVSSALDRGDAAVVIAVSSHLDGLCERLDDDRASTLMDSGQLICLDADNVLKQIMNGVHPDRSRFEAIVGPLVRKAKSRCGGLAAYGELVNILWQQQNYAAAKTLEDWWNVQIQEHGFSLLCGYRADILSMNDDIVDRFDEVCQTHSHIAACEDAERMDAALNLALQQVLPGSDLEGLRHAMTDHTRPDLMIPSSHAVLLGLNRLLPSLANDVRVIARNHYWR